MAGLEKWQLKNLRRNNQVMHAALSAPCDDCNITWHPLVMTFDHRDRADKRYTLSNIRTVSPKEFDAEMAKCDIVCRNCHQVREYLRDMNVIDIGEVKKNRYRYYERLVPYLCGGALLRKDAFNLVPIGVL